MSGVDRDELKAEAEGLGLEFPANIPTAKLEGLIEEARASVGESSTGGDPEDAPAEVSAPDPEDPQVRTRPKVNRGAVTTNTPESKADVDTRTPRPQGAGHEDPVTLREQVDEDPVWYSMDCGMISIAERRSDVVQLANGEWERVPRPFLRLEATGPKRDSGRSRAFYLSNPEDAKQVELIDQWIRQHPEQAAVARVQKQTKPRPAAPVPTWDSLNADACVRIVAEAKLDPLAAVKYELAKGADAREDVIDALESWHAEEGLRRAEAAAQAADLGESVDAVAI